MRNRFLLAFVAILALGAGAVLAISTVSPPAVSPVAAVEPAPVPEPTRTPEGPPAVAAAPAAAVPAQATPPPPSPGPAPLAAPVRAAPVAAPEFADQLQSEDADDRSAAMLEMRQRRQAQSMERLNRRRALRSP